MEKITPKLIKLLPSVRRRESKINFSVSHVWGPLETRGSWATGMKRRYVRHWRVTTLRAKRNAVKHRNTKRVSYIISLKMFHIELLSTALVNKTYFREEMRAD
jgi:hypothetical protein